MISPVYIAGYGSACIALAGLIATVVVIVRSRAHKLPLYQDWLLAMIFIAGMSTTMIGVGAVGAQMDASVAAEALTVTVVLTLVVWTMVGYLMHKFTEELKDARLRVPMSPAHG